MNQVKLNVEELKNFIKHMINNNQHIQAEGNHLQTKMDRIS